ncbi:MAG TPA: DUF2914 domain-containing protein [Pseudomonadales bacterium]|nr:DUF2914 domain-containing protein [Pseudomonadales bacterium]
MTTTIAQSRPAYEYEYRWERIIPVVAALIIGIALLAWGIWALFSHSEKPLAEPVAQTVTPDTQQITLPPPVIGTASNPTAEVKPAVVEPAPAPQMAPATAAVTASPVVAPAATNRAPAPATRTPAPVVTETKKAEVDAAPEPAALKPGQISVAGQGATRVTLQQVLDQEPLDLKKGSIYVGQEKAVKVIFSAELGKPGDTVHYRWFHNGKLVAKVRTKVSPEGVTHSSKFISYDAPGEWQVQMLNKNGKLVAETAFSAKTK